MAATDHSRNIPEGTIGSIESRGRASRGHSSAPPATRELLCAALLLALAPAGLLGQESGAIGEGPLVPGQRDTVKRAHLITIDQGDLVWEKFGHNALWIHDPAAETDVVYNWGIFDFDQADFFRRLLFGHMRYMVASAELRATLWFYRMQGRTVRVQELRLTPEEVDDLQRRARTAVLPENRHYAYDPFRDNCSSRIRDLLDRVADGAIRARTDTVATGTTFRSHTRRLLQRVPWALAGITAMLGSRTDRELSAWEEMFLPMRLADRLERVRVPGPDGEPVALAGPSRTLHEADRPGAPAAPPGFGIGWAVAGAVGAGLLLLLAWRARAQGRAARHLFGATAGLWSLAAGLAGTVMAAGWVLTEHWYVHANENLLQLQPLSLGLAVLLPLAASGGQGRRAAELLAGATAALSGAGLLLQLLPGFDQANAEVLALAVPLHVAVLVGLRSLPTGDGERPG